MTKVADDTGLSLTAGSTKHYLYRMDEIGDNHLRSTSEMFTEITKYGFTKSDVEDFVFNNPDKIYDMIEPIKVVHKAEEIFYGLYKFISRRNSKGGG